MSLPHQGTRNISMEVGTYYRRPASGGVAHPPLYYQVIEKLKDRKVRIVNLHSDERYTLTENDLSFYSMQIMFESEMSMILLGDAP
jgi:hypothetical protein